MPVRQKHACYVFGETRSCKRGINQTLKCLKAPPQPIMESLVESSTYGLFHNTNIPELQLSIFGSKYATAHD